MRGDSDDLRPIGQEVQAVGKLLIWFSILYGELTTAVVAIIGINYWMETDSGTKTCTTLKLEGIACQSTLSLAVLVLIGIALVTTWRRFNRARLNIKDKKDL